MGDSIDISWLAIPFGVVALICIWAQIAPLSQWRALWSWQYRFSHVKGERAQREYVRRLTVVPLVLSVVLGAFVLFVG